MARITDALPSTIPVKLIVPVLAFEAGNNVQCCDPLFATRAMPASV
jgi:hypothetical protein